MGRTACPEAICKPLRYRAGSFRITICRRTSLLGGIEREVSQCHRPLTVGAHAALILDGAGWHDSQDLVMPSATQKNLKLE